MEVERIWRIKMNNDFITKQCERCGEEVRVPREYPGNDNLLRIVQVPCPNNHKSYTYDYDRMKWWR